MANTFVKIQTVTVGSGGAANIEFTSIPQTYTDLQLVISTRTAGSGAANYSVLTINDTSTSGRFLEGNGSSVSSGASQSSNIDVSSGATASVFSNASFYFPNYTSSNKKSYSVDGVAENNATAGYTGLVAGLYDSTTAITKIKLAPNTAVNYVEYTTATLYGIKSS